MILAIAGSKGGTGKTTLSVHLAGWLHQHGWATVLVDCDLQQLSSKWLERAMPEIPFERLHSPEEVVSRLQHLAEEFEVVVVDGPGDLSETTGAILAVADACLLPTAPSKLDIDGLSWTIQTIQEIQKTREDNKPDAIIVPVKASENFKATRYLYDMAPRFGFGITPDALPYRQVYIHVAGLQGPPRLLWQLGRSQQVRVAALEMDKLFRGAFPEACEEDPQLIYRMVTPPKKQTVQQQMRSNEVEYRKAI